jgi:hypothetical protein
MYEQSPPRGNEQQKIDQKDVIFVVILGISFVLLKIFEFMSESAEIGPSLIKLACIIVIVYILWRARDQPEKLQEWGLTTPITGKALAFFISFLLLAIFSLGVAGWTISGMVQFEIHYVVQIIDYVTDAFLQQFIIFAIGVVSFEKRFPRLRNKWRLPLLLGILFTLGHLYDIKFLWGIPIPVLIIFPLGFFATYYFQRFRTILPLIAIHAIGYVFLSNWIVELL